MTGYICGPHQYLFHGALIEESGIGGPWAIRSNGEPYIRLPKKVAEALDAFCELSDKDKATYHIGGGCVSI